MKHLKMIIFLIMLLTITLTKSTSAVDLKVDKLPEISLDPAKYSDHYIDRVTTFAKLPNDKGEIIFLGDSITEICEWSALFSNFLVKNRGISNDDTDCILNRLSEVIESHPKKIFLMAGINDICREKSTDYIINNFKKIINIVIKYSPKTQIYIQSVLPINKDLFKSTANVDAIVDLNDHLNLMCKELKIDFIDLYPLFTISDKKLNPEYTTAGIHLNGKGYMIWKKAIEHLVN